MSGRTGIKGYLPWLAASLALHLLLLACIPALDSESQCPVMLLVTINSPKAAELTRATALAEPSHSVEAPAPTPKQLPKARPDKRQPVAKKHDPQIEAKPSESRLIANARPEQKPDPALPAPTVKPQRQPISAMEFRPNSGTTYEVPRTDPLVVEDDNAPDDAETATPAAPPAQPAIDIEALKLSYGAGVINKVQGAKYFPDAARDSSRAGESVSVRLSFVVTSGGQLAGVSVSSGSGVPTIDAAAQDALRRAAPFGAFPAGLEAPQLNLAVTLRYTLN